MNIIHMKYALEVAKVGSINKASETLNMAQPNISRAIKDLEADLGITIFDRSAKGMNLTPEGKEFIAYAQKILNQLNELENMFKSNPVHMQKFSASVPRTAYISNAFSRFSNSIGRDEAEIIFDISDAYGTIKKVINSECKLGVIRYEKAADKQFKELLEENSLSYKVLKVFKPVLMVNKDSRLAKMDSVYKGDLYEMIQITHTKPYAATLTLSDSLIDEVKEDAARCIFTIDSATQLEILANNTEAFMWIASAPDELLERYGLTEIECRDALTEYYDVLIYKKDYKYSELDKKFIELLSE